MSLSRKELQDTVNTALAGAMADDVIVRVRSSSAGNTRFAAGGVTTSGDVETLDVRVTACVGGRVATVSGNIREKTALRALVRDAEELAAISPKDPEWVEPVAPPVVVPKVDGVSTAAAKMSAKERAAVAGEVLDAAAATSFNPAVAGLLTHETVSDAIGNSRGLFLAQTRTEVSLTTTFRTPDGKGSGWAGYESHALQGLDAAALAGRAAEKAELSALASSMEPGRKTVLLEAQAVGDLVSFLLGAMSRRAADEGLSAFSRKGGGTLLGDKLFDERITVRSDPADVAGPARAFDGDGLAHKARTWIDKGVLSALPCDRFWATKHSLEAIPLPSQLRIEGTDADLLALLKGMEEGIVITRLWYNRLVDPRTILATGLTRDGVFAVEKGRIVGAVNNFRYNESPLTLFKRVVAIGRPERVVAGGGTVMVVPPMVVEGFELSSKSDAV